MKNKMVVVANFGKRWLVDPGWRRNFSIACTVAAYAALHLAAYLSGGFPTLVLTTNFFLILVASGLLGLWGGIAAGTLSGVLAGPLLMFFIVPRDERTSHCLLDIPIHGFRSIRARRGDDF